jgi:RNA polymerase sigma factor (sigma-70 family)
MQAAASKTQIVESKKLALDDPRLVRACLDGDQEAWGVLIERYKRLIFSIPIKFGLDREDSADIFQSVCVELLQRLPSLREPKALPKWLMEVTAHKCMERKREGSRFVEGEAEEPAAPVEDFPETIFAETQKEQALRTALASLSPRCRELMRLLFYEIPSRPYAEVAATLGLAMGSIGFIRGRCLQKLRRAMSEAGYQ